MATINDFKGFANATRVDWNSSIDIDAVTDIDLIPTWLPEVGDTLTLMADAMQEKKINFPVKFQITAGTRKDNQVFIPNIPVEITTLMGFKNSQFMAVAQLVTRPQSAYADWKAWKGVQFKDGSKASTLKELLPRLKKDMKFKVERTFDQYDPQYKREAESRGRKEFKRLVRRYNLVEI